MRLRYAAIDVGNTSTAVGRVSRGRVSHVAHLNGGIRADLAACEDALRRVVDAGPLDGVILGSVVPQINEGWIRLVRMVSGFEAVLVNHRAHARSSGNWPDVACR